MDPAATRWWEIQRRFALRPERFAALVAELGTAIAMDILRHPSTAKLVALGEAPSASRAKKLEREGWWAVPYAFPAYPDALAAIADPPPLLWVRGDPARISSPGLAIVGARDATSYGLSVTRALARDLAAGGIAIVSGLARGIDGEAHRGALASGSTLAVLGHGPDRVYPAAHRALAEAIAQRGALVSEFPPGVTPRPHFFPLRNRVISGLSQGVVVVEAKRRSGSLVTARHALEQGREVMAVPGPIDLETSSGPNALLRDGAHVILESGDVFRALGRDAPASEPESADPLLELLARAPLHDGEIASRLGKAIEWVSRRVAHLEIEGRLVRGADGRLTRVSLS